MVSHMKTTVQISDGLFEEMRRLAQQDETTMRCLVEEGLRRVIAERHRTTPFRLRRATFKGEGLQPRLNGASWDQIREMTYEGRGG